MMKILLLIVLFFSLDSFAQKSQLSADKEITRKPTLGERGLNRLFMDGSMGFGFVSHFKGEYNHREYTFTSDYRIGNNFYLGKGNSTMIIRLTYIRVGVNFGSFGAFPYLVPPQIGLGKHFRIKPTVSIEPSVHFGFLYTNGDTYSGVFDLYGYFFMPEVKFNFSKFCVGVEFTTRKFTDSEQPLTFYDRNYYFGFSLGRRIGRGL